MTTFLSHDTTMDDDAGFQPGGGVPCGAEAADQAAARGPGRPSGKTPEKVHAVCTFIRMTGLADTVAAAMAGVTRSTLARWKKEDEEVEMQLEVARAQYQMPRLEKIGETRMKDGQHDWRAQAWLIKFANPQVHGAPSRRRRLQDVELEPAEAARPLTREEEKAKEAAESQAALEEAVEGWEKFHRNPSQGVITPMMLALMQQRRAIAIRDMMARDAAAAGASPAHETDEMGLPPAEAGESGSCAESGARSPRAGGHQPGGLQARPFAPSSPSSGGGAPGGVARNVTIRPEIHGFQRDEETWQARTAAMVPGRRSIEAMAGKASAEFRSVAGGLP